MSNVPAWTGGDPGEAPVGTRPAENFPPESFEVDEPHSKHSNWEFVEYLSYTIDGPADLGWMLLMQTAGRDLRRFDP